MLVQLPKEVTAADGDVIQVVADAAEREVALLIVGLPDEITLMVSVGGPFVIPETGDGGASVATGRVAWAVDPRGEAGSPE